MRFYTLMTIFLALGLLTGCGEDVGGRNGRRAPQATTQGASDRGDANLISSHMHRLRATAPIPTYLQEIEFTLSNTLPPGLRTIPLMEIDDEGTHGMNVMTMRDSRPSTTCGIGENFKGIDARINDCRLKNNDSALWNGYLSGASGEGSWKLVALTTRGKEIWQDVRTGMVWSDNEATGNWCMASGNNQEASLDISTDCKTLGETKNLCSEISTDGIGTNIRWRLPTRNDFLQADLNGLRFVMSHGDEFGFWTATMQSGIPGRTHAWVYYPGQGTLEAQALTSVRGVRCVGAPVN
jgi:hypothetical protein